MPKEHEVKVEAKTGDMVATMEGEILTIRIPLGGKDRSQSGKNIVKASTGGFVPLLGFDGHDTLKISINAIER